MTEDKPAEGIETNQPTGLEQVEVVQVPENIQQVTTDLGEVATQEVVEPKPQKYAQGRVHGH